MVKLMKLNNRGMNTILALLLMSAIILMSQTFMLMDRFNVFKGVKQSQNMEVRNNLIADLENIVSEELALRNSRFDVNANLYRCLYANPSPCSELETYDLVLYSPNPPVLYKGGVWPSPPSGISIIAGGQTTNPIFYTGSAGICPSMTAANNACPLQAIVRFRPLCGGTISTPEQQTTPGVCPGRATGFDVIVGVGLYVGNSVRYTGEVTPNGDSRVYRIKANSLLN